MELYHASKRAKRQIYFLLSFCCIENLKSKIKGTIQKTWHIDVKNLRIK